MLFYGVFFWSFFTVVLELFNTSNGRLSYKRMSLSDNNNNNNNKNDKILKQSMKLNYFKSPNRKSPIALHSSHLGTCMGILISRIVCTQTK